MNRDGRKKTEEPLSGLREEKRGNDEDCLCYIIDNCT
jgi:hypothetical protein